MELNLASLKSVKRFADEFKSNYSELHLLINNAGLFYPDNENKRTEDGFEIHFGTHHIGHFYLTKLLLDTLKATKGSRVIIVSSMLHESGKISLNDLTIDSYSNIIGYASSKLANVYFCKELAKRLHNTGVNVYTLCPGWVYTSIFKHYPLKWYNYILILPTAFLFMRTPSQGAQTVLYCATEPQLDQETGLLYKNCNKFNSKVNFDTRVSTKLWEFSEDLINQAIR